MGRGDDDRDRRLTYGWWWWWWGDDVDDDAGEVTEVEDEKDERLGLSALVEPMRCRPPEGGRPDDDGDEGEDEEDEDENEEGRGLVESAPTAAPACRWSSQRLFVGLSFGGSTDRCVPVLGTTVGTTLGID